MSHDRGRRGRSTVPGGIESPRLQLLLYAFHEFTEAGAVPGIDNAYWHLATEDWAEGLIGELIVAAMVLAPLAWIALRHLESRPLNGRDARNRKN